MKIFELYANGPSVDFNHIEDLKKNDIIKKRLFNEDGSVKKLHLCNDRPYYENFLNVHMYCASLFENVTYSDGSEHTWKLATLITHSVDDMLEAFKELGIQLRDFENTELNN